MAYIKLTKSLKTIVYEDRTDSLIEAPWGENLFDFLLLNMDEYDEIYKTVESDLVRSDLDKLFEKYPKTAETHTWVKMYADDGDDSNELSEYTLPFLFENKDAFSMLYNHPYIGLSDTFLEGVSYDFGHVYFDADLKQIHQAITQLVQFCFLENSDEKLNELTPQERYFYFCATHVLSYKYVIKTHSTIQFFPSELYDKTRKDLLNVNRKDTIDIIDTIEKPLDYSLIAQIKNGVDVTLVNECNTVKDFVFWEFNTLLLSNTQIKRCKYCNRLFIPKGNYNTDCCDRIPINEKYSCKKLMATKRRKEKVKTSPFTREYDKAYKRIYARVSNHKMTKEDFRLWVDAATQRRDLAIEQYKATPSDQIINNFKEYLGNK